MTKIGTAFIDVKADLSGFQKELDRQTSTTSSKFSKIGKAAALGFGAGLGAAGIAIKGFADAAIDAQKSQARMETQLKASGVSFKAHAKEIDNVIQKVSKLSGLDDEDLQDAFTNLIRTTGSVSESLKLTGLAADFARAKHMDVAKAGEIVAKVAGGNTGILSRYGVSIDKGASSTEALGKLQEKFAGQAKAYGDTTAGANDRFKVAVENLQESLGQKLLPALATVANAAANFINGLQTGEGVAGDVAGAFDTVKTRVSELGDRFSGVADIVSTLWTKFGDNVIGVMQAVAGQIRDQVENVTKIFQGLIDFVSGVLSGDWGKAWTGIKEMFSGAVQAILDSAKHMFEVLRQVFDAGVKVLAAVWKTALDGLVAALKGIASAIASAAKFVVDTAINAIKATASSLVDVGKFITNQIAAGIKVITEALGSVGGWVKNRVTDLVTAEIVGLKAVGSYIINRVADGIKVVTDLLGSVGGWIKNRVTDLVTAEADALKSVGAFITNRVAEGIKTLTEALSGVGGWIKNRVTDAITGAKDGFLSIGRSMMNWIIDGLEGGVNLLIGFVNKIISVINKIPGVEIKPIAKFARGGTTDDIPGFATGGVAHHDTLARGSQITRPMMVVGEEAPRHPEYIIPTNPAYRDRAMGLFGLLGQKLGVPGFATGGTVVRGRVSVFGPPLEPAGTTASGLSSSAAGLALNINPGTDSGWNNATTDKWVRDRQLFAVSIGGHSAVLPVIDKGPAGFTGRAIDVTGAGSRALDLNPSNFPTDSIGTAQELSGSGSAQTNSVGLSSLLSGLLGSLPGLGGIPDWIKGTAQLVLDKAKSFIASKVTSVLGIGNANLSVDQMAAVENMVKEMDRIDARHFEYEYGGGHYPATFDGPYDCSGLVSAILRAGGLMIGSMTTDGLKTYGASGDGKVITIGVRGSTGRDAHTMMKLGNRYLESGGSAGGAKWVNGWDGSFDVYRHPVGYAKGGVIDPQIMQGLKLGDQGVGWGLARGGVVGPYVGSYKVGGTVPQDGFAYVHAGEQITPAGQAESIPEVHVYLDGQRIDDKVEIKFRERDAQTRQTFRAGVRA